MSGFHRQHRGVEIGTDKPSHYRTGRRHHDDNGDRQAYQICRYFGTCRMGGRLIPAPYLFLYNPPEQDHSFSLSFCTIDKLSLAEPLLECDLRLNEAR